MCVVCVDCVIWGGYSATSDLDLGKKLEIWILGGGYSATSDLDLGKKLEIWILGGYSATSDLDLGKCNFGFGGGGILQLRIWT